MVCILLLCVNLADVTQLPGYQALAADCPDWKRAFVEKKNEALLSVAMVCILQLPMEILYLSELLAFVELRKAESE